ncbi:cell surface protein [Lacticaseibacillus paracasei]|uniref:cell surface protein n=1 Tax=Lacticaseibacillus paracasei TaxID=1597 RepID=UPI0031DA7B18
MKKFLSLLLVVALVLSSAAFPRPVEAAELYPNIVLSKTDREWKDFIKLLKSTKVGTKEGEAVDISLKPSSTFKEERIASNLVIEVGQVGRDIVEVKSSDPETLAATLVNKSTIRLKRGIGTNSKVSISVKYRLTWKFDMRAGQLGPFTSFQYYTVNSNNYSPVEIEYSESMEMKIPLGFLLARNAKYVLGEKWNTASRSRMMVSATDADGSPVNYSDSRIGATIPDELSKRIKNGRIDANIDSPVGLFFKSSGGRVDSPGKATSSYGNAVVLRGFEAQNGVESTRDAAGAFALIEEDGSPKIIATSGAVNDNDKIHQEFPGKFYVETALFSMNNVNDLSLANQSPTKVITANGDEKKQDFLDRWGSARAMSVNYGDVFKAKEAEGKIGYTQASNYTSLDTYQQPKEIFFEVTKNGYKPLAINQLSSKKISVTQKDSQSSIAQQLQNTIDTKGNSNITIEKFSEYPDVDTAGEKTAKVLVSQTLSSGKKVSYPYEVPVTVVAKPGKLKTQEAFYKLGEKWNTENRSRMMVSATDTDGSDVPYSDGRVGSSNPDEVKKALKDDRIDKLFKASVELVFSSMGGTVTSISPVEAKYGNAIVLRGYEYGPRDSAGVFALIEENGNPKIIATSGKSTDNEAIHSSFPGKFYVETALYSMNQHTELALDKSTPTMVIKANGDDKKQDFLNRWGASRTLSVNYGDVFKAKEAEGKIGYTQDSTYTSLDRYQQPKEIFFEVTKNGYRPLQINQLTFKGLVVPPAVKKEAIEKEVKTAIDKNKQATVTFEKITDYPDTTHDGFQDVKVQVSEKLTSGNKVFFTYTIPVVVKDTDDQSDDQFILTAKNITAYSNQLANKTSDQLAAFILKQSQAQAWEKNKQTPSEKIKMITTDLKPEFGTYQATLAIGKLRKEISINVLASNNMIDLTIPKSLAFGSTDVDQGQIVSPNYEIKNRSKTKVKVVLQQVKTTTKSSIKLVHVNDPDPVNASESARLFLKGNEKFTANKIPLDDSTANQELGTLDDQAKTSVSLSGQYFGDYSSRQNLAMDLTFKFEVLH